MRVLIVDDEAPARQKLRSLLAGESDIELVGEAEDGSDAVALIRSLSPDLVLLDIQMPRLDGFEVIAEVGVAEMPLVVFVTAYDEHALRAFEVHAFDYLLKPFGVTRFRQVLERARERLARTDAEQLARRLTRLVEGLESERKYASRILVERAEQREALIAVDSIDRVQAERNYVRLFTAGGEFLRRGTLSALAERLDPSHFVRVNRSTIIRLDAVRELQPWSHGDYHVLLKDGTTLTWSRRYRDRATDLL
jgi:two-component system LytT family response regulator